MTRRGFLLGAAASGLLAACGGPGGGPTTNPQLVALYSPDRVLVAGIPQRIPFAVVDIGDLALGDTEEVRVTIRLDDQVVDTVDVIGRVVDHDHPGADVDPDHAHADLLRYFALRAELPTPGVYDLEADFGSAGIGRLPVQIFDPGEVALAVPGAPLPPITTPTVTAPEGIAPLCTLAPEPCPFHDLDVADVVADGRPLALLVATPALCTTAYCGPVVETLIETAPEFDGIEFVHLEVYANAEDVGGNYNDPALRLAQPVIDLGLTFEPSLFLVDGDGIVVDRIDNLFDRDELRGALASL